MSHGQVWINGCKSRSPGPLPSWPDTRQLWSWSHIPCVSTLTADRDSVWVHRVLANKALLLLFTKLYHCNGKVLTATGEGGVNASLTGFKLLVLTSEQTSKIASHLPWSSLSTGLHIKGKKLQACLAWNQKALARGGGGKTAPVPSLPCPTWNVFFPSALKPCQDDSRSCRQDSVRGESVPKPSWGWIWHQQNASTSAQGFNNQMQDGYTREMGSQWV